MCLNFFAFTFIVLAIVLVIQLGTLCFDITKNMKPMVSSNYISSIAGVMFAYVINSFILFFLIPDIYSKFLMVAYGLIPFIIGSVVNYKRVRFYSFIQILCVISSIFYVIG